MADGLNDNSSRLTKDDFHNYVNKEITLVRSNDIMTYVRRKHTRLSNDRKVRPKIWTKYHDQCSNDDSIRNILRMELSTINAKAIGLLEVLNLHITEHLSVFRLEMSRGPRKEW